MPSINFPSGPSLNDTYNLGTRTWKWNGEAWALQPLTGGFTGSQGSIGYTGSGMVTGSNTLLDANTQLQFGNTGEHIYGDGTDLKIGASEIHITAGRVGIGTDNPSKLFQLAASGEDVPMLRIETTDGGNKRIDLRVENSIGYLSANQSSQRLAFETTNVERMRIDASGNIGIGTTSPATKLHVVSPDTAALTTVLQLDNPNAAGKGVDMEFSQNTNVKHRIKSYYDATNQWTLGIDTEDTADAFNIVDNGHIGIGTKSPSAPLHVEVSGGGFMRIGRTGFTGYLHAETDGTNATIRSASATGSLKLQTDGNNDRLTISSAGTVAIPGALTLGGVSNSTSIIIKNSSGTALKTMYGTTS